MKVFVAILVIFLLFKAHSKVSLFSLIFFSILINFLSNFVPIASCFQYMTYYKILHGRHKNYQWNLEFCFCATYTYIHTYLPFHKTWLPVREADLFMHSDWALFNRQWMSKRWKVLSGLLWWPQMHETSDS